MWRILTVLVFATCLGAAVRGETPALFQPREYAQPGMFYAPTKGPDEIPYGLEGIWQVSLCVKKGYDKGHAWIRYQNVETGEVHTIGRFKSGRPGIVDPESNEYLYPPVDVSGLYWDLDIKREHEVQQGKYLLKSVKLRNPQIYRSDDVYGHGVIRANCVTYVRDAWSFYSSEWYELPTIHTPESLINAMLKEPSAAPAKDGKKSRPPSAASPPPGMPGRARDARGPGPYPY